MDNRLSSFVWPRPLDGYSWTDASALNDPPSSSASRPMETRFLRWRTQDSPASSSTPLFENPTLFREFANLEPTEESFLGFANRYGWLGVPQLLFPRADGGPGASDLGSTGDHRPQGEPFWRWKSAHQEMWRVNGVLAVIAAGDTETLARWFEIHPTIVKYQRQGMYGDEAGVVCGTDLKPSLWKWGNEGRDRAERLKRFASVWAQKKINDAVSGVDGSTRTSLRVALDSTTDRMSLQVVPESLLAAMWLQCARVLTDSPTFKSCECCGKWFEISAGERRRHSIYCSDRCKVAAHRARKSRRPDAPASEAGA